MSDKQYSLPDDFRSPKRARTFPLAPCVEADTLDDSHPELGRRSTALGPKDNFAPSEVPSHMNEGEQDKETSDAFAESYSSQRVFRSPANKRRVQRSYPDQGVSEASQEENEPRALSPLESFTTRKSIEDRDGGESDELILQHSPPLRNESSKDHATGPVDDENTSQKGDGVYITTSTDDSDSIYKYLAELDADELALLNSTIRPPILSWDELRALPVPPPEANFDEQLGPWSQPAEPLRPPNPYKKGQKLMVQKHKACPPFGSEYADYSGLRKVINDMHLRTKTLVEICLKHPPMEGQTARDDPLRSLHIIDEIRVKDNGGAQLIVCRLNDEQDEYAAKIYDPLYYGFSDRMWSDKPRDVTFEADQDYCREVAAYLELDEHLGGKETPKYYGSWTFQLSIDLPGGRKTRDVRMILMERIKGGTMSEMDPPPYPEDVRLEALAQTLEAVNRIHSAGVLHRDIAQRNVMICDSETGPPTIDRVVIIDFNYAVVTRLAEWRRSSGGRRQQLPEKPRNPIDDWWDCGGLYNEFGEWVPASWDRLYKPMREWLYTRWGKSDEFSPHMEPLIWEQE